jgi:pilus assembly protein CpaB
VLKSGNRAVSIAVDAMQSVAGLILPGNHVDIILTQNLTDSADNKRAVAETILTGIRVIAVDQAMSQPVTRSSADSTVSASIEPRMPKTVTLEVTERQAEKVFVALQMGALQLSVRPLVLAANAGVEAQAAAPSSPTWSSDVSRAAANRTVPAPAVTSGSTLESYIRRPPAF